MRIYLFIKEVTMKNTLTIQEQALIPLVRDERINKLNNPKPIDRETATPLIERLY